MTKIHGVAFVCLMMLSTATQAFEGSSCKRMALTFDDGPVVGKTEKILAVLADKHLKATFFMLGQNARAHPSLVEEVVRQGHEIGVHGDTHTELTKISKEEAQHDIKRAFDTLSMYQSSLLYWRAPYGSVPPNFSYPKHLGLQHVGWGIDSLDWRRRGVLSEVNQVVSRFHNGAVILFHDHVAFTPPALLLIIEEAQHQGYTLGSVSMLSQACHLPEKLPKELQDIYLDMSDTGYDKEPKMEQNMDEDDNYILIEPLPQ